MSEQIEDATVIDKETVNENTVSKETFTEDGLYLGNLIRNLMPVDPLKFNDGGTEDGTDPRKASPLFGMSEEDFKKTLEEIDFRRSLYEVKHNFKRYGLVLNEGIADITELQIADAVSALDIQVKEEAAGFYSSIVYLRGGFIGITDRRMGNCYLRALIAKRTGVIFNNNDVLDVVQSYYTTINQLKTSPKAMSEDELNELAKACGTSIEEINEDYREKSEIAHGAAANES